MWAVICEIHYLFLDYSCPFRVPVAQCVQRGSTAFHYHSPVVLIWLKYCWKWGKIANHTAIYHAHSLLYQNQWSCLLQHTHTHTCLYKLNMWASHYLSSLPLTGFDRVRVKMSHCCLDETEFTTSEPHFISRTTIHKQSHAAVVQILRSFCKVLLWKLFGITKELLGATKRVTIIFQVYIARPCGGIKWLFWRFLCQWMINSPWNKYWQREPKDVHRPFSAPSVS